ncbi:MAG: hypothetical protein AB3N33_02960 [Puniceicoccaceae bacterium]
MFRPTGCLALFLLSTALACAGETVVAILGGQPVFEDEYRFHEERVKTNVASRIMRLHGVDMSPDFWTTEVDGVTPGETLKNEALRSIARFRVVQTLAVEQGLLEAVMSYRDMITAFHEENLRRKEMKEAGEIFYGPVQFRKDVYISVRLEQLTRALQKAALSDEVILEEDAVKTQLEEIIRKRIDSLIDANTP